MTLFLLTYGSYSDYGISDLVDAPDGVTKESIKALADEFNRLGFKGWFRGELAVRDGEITEEWKAHKADEAKHYADMGLDGPDLAGWLALRHGFKRVPYSEAWLSG